MSEYSGMTVNERLAVSGKLNEYDKAVADKDADVVRDILIGLEVDEASTEAIIEQYVK